MWQAARPGTVKMEGTGPSPGHGCVGCAGCVCVSPLLLGRNIIGGRGAVSTAASSGVRYYWRLAPLRFISVGKVRGVYTHTWLSITTTATFKSKFFTSDYAKD